MTNFLRCAAMLSIMLLAACDADKQPPSAPVPKDAAAMVPLPAKAAALPAAESSTPTVDTASFPAAVPAAPFKQLEREPVQPVYELSPNVPVVSVVATAHDPGPSKKIAVTKANANAKANSAPAEIKLRAPIASKTKPAKQVVEQTHLARPTLDLSLPSDMVDQMQPAGKVAPIVHTGVLPQMFSEKKSGKDTPFQLNGRLLSNEMQLQRRDEDRHGVEGAALDFEFKQ